MTLLAAALGLGLVSMRITTLQVRRPVRKATGEDVDATARLLLIGLTAGLPLTAALQLAADELGRDRGAPLVRLLRRARVSGLAAALAGGRGEEHRLLHRLARAQMTGAPIAGTITTFIAEERAARRAEIVERLRKLPVTLTVPLALLILPGFILLTLGPTVAGIVRQLLGGLL
jgi:pilus assembly protein TadC